MRVSDYIVDFLYRKKINMLFTVTGGFAMNLNDSFGIFQRKNKDFEIFYQHHEQAAGYSAIGYSKLKSQPSYVISVIHNATTHYANIKKINSSDNLLSD